MSTLCVFQVSTPVYRIIDCLASTALNFSCISWSIDGDAALYLYVDSVNRTYHLTSRYLQRPCLFFVNGVLVASTDPHFIVFEPEEEANQDHTWLFIPNLTMLLIVFWGLLIPYLIVL